MRAAPAMVRLTMVALAQALIKLPVGEIVELQTEDGGKRKVRIEVIRNYKQ